MKTILFTSMLVCFLPNFVHPQACTLNANNTTSEITSLTFNGNGTCNVTVNLSFVVVINNGSKFMGVNISTPVIYSTSPQVSPAGDNGAGTYAINSFTNIHLNNISWLTLQTTGISGNIWLTNAAASGGTGPQHCSTPALQFAITNLAAFTVLPVKIQDFFVKNETGKFSFSWITTTESNIKEFKIQRKIDDGNFQDLVVLPSKAPANNSNNKLLYKVEFPELMHTGFKHFFRIAIVSLNGRIDYSEIETQDITNNSVFTIFPNPAVDYIKLKLSPDGGKVNVAIHDISGRIVQEWRNIESQNLSLQNFKKGFYFIKVVFLKNNKCVNEKLLIN